MKLPSHLPMKYPSNGPDDPPESPHDGNGNGRFIRSFDNILWLFYRQWNPPQGVNVKATLMIIHGTVDHGGQYHHLALKLSEAGVTVFAMDMRGWGRSDGESMYVDDLEETFTHDVEHLYRIIHDQPTFEPVKARFLLGKSLGGTLAAICAHKFPDNWAGLIGLSGAFELEPSLANPSWFKLTALKLLVSIVPKLPFKSLFDEHLIVKDEGALQTWRNDPLCGKDKLRVGYAYNLIKGVQLISKLSFDVPMLMLCGEADKVVMIHGHEQMLEINSCDDKSIKVYKDGFHNLLLEPTLQEQVEADILQWIMDRSN